MLRRRLALIAAAALLVLAACASAAVDLPPRAVHVGSFRWQADLPGFGGYSGLELEDDGAGFAALSDRGHMVEGRLQRDGKGAITGVRIARQWKVLSADGRWRQGLHNDTEGLARAPQGGFYISYEGIRPHVARVAGPDQPAIPLRAAPEFARLPLNAALEALAIDAEGRLYTLPEAPPEGSDAFPVWRYTDGTWEQPFSIPARGSYRATGADIGPDGRFYLLERQFSLLGFSSRVRRFDLGPEGLTGEVTLLQSPRGRHGNLEGISVWRDAEGAIRLTMVSDNNQLWLVATELVDYRIESE